MEFDEVTFDQLFEFYEHESFKSSGRPIGLRNGETMIRSLKIVNRDFIEKIKGGLVALEKHLQGEFGQGISFNYLAYEKTGLIY